MKYFIELGVRAKGVQLKELTENEKNELLDKNLDEIYLDLIEEFDSEFTLENYYLTPFVDRFSLTIRDENDNIVYESEEVGFLIDRTYDNDGEVLAKGWEFEGIKKGYYLTRLQTIKGCWCTGEFELNEPFDKDKLYVLQDRQIDDELFGYNVYPLFVLYYQRGEGTDMDRDKIELDFDSDLGEQYFDTYLLELDRFQSWVDLQDDKLK